MRSSAMPPCAVLVVRSHERAEAPKRRPIIHMGGR